MISKIAIFVILAFALFAMVAQAAEVRPLVDVKPGSCPNAVNMNKKGVLPVAIFGSEMFDVTNVDPETIELGLTSSPSFWIEPVKLKIDDVDKDGYMDLIFHFSVPDLKEIYMDELPDNTDPWIPVTIGFEDDDGISIEPVYHSGFLFLPPSNFK